MKNISVNGTDYEVYGLLGKGKGGYSYLVGYGQKKYVLKQIHHEPCDYYHFGDKLQSELNDYKKLRDLGVKMPMLIDVDVAQERIVKEYIDGETVFDLVLQDKMKSQYFESIKDMCKLLYAAGTNIDYFPTNFVVGNDELYYVDYECNVYSDEWNFENWGVKYWSKTEELAKYVNEHTHISSKPE